jgi:hypothetical protein
MNKLLKLKYILIFSLSMIIISCGDDDLEPTLAQDKDLSTGINNATDLAGVLNSAYDRMTATSYYGRDKFIMQDVITDNMYSNQNSGRFGDSDMDYSPNGAGPWTQIYAAIAITNIVIGADHASLDGDQGQINHTLGQAHALRALLHFDLLQDYGQHFVNGGGTSALGVPYVKTYKDPANLAPPRDIVSSNVADIVSDLQTGISLMNDSYNISSSYMNRAAAYAILARAALYVGDYSTAEQAASWVISNSSAAPSSASGFAATYVTDNAVNSLFELAFSGTDSRGINGLAYILRGTSYGDVRILTGDGPGEDLYDIFESGDVRFSLLGTSEGYPSVLGKYPSMDGSDNVTILRIEEMHLILAETAVRSGDNATALQYINNVATNRGASAYSGTVTLKNVLDERRKEFFLEGLRFHDLSRTGQDMPLIDAVKQLNDDLTGTPPSFGSYRYAMPIYLSELNANPNMVQNEGY